MELKTVCVYCASSAKVDKAYFDPTEILAKELVKAGIELDFATNK